MLRELGLIEEALVNVAIKVGNEKRDLHCLEEKERKSSQ